MWGKGAEGERELKIETQPLNLSVHRMVAVMVQTLGKIDVWSISTS